jgi:hypothetical protein
MCCEGWIESVSEPANMARPGLRRTDGGSASTMTAEHIRLDERDTAAADWDLWGPYLSERAWGTVREDYGTDGAPWDHFTHDQARSRAYRWNEDGLAGISDQSQYLCFGVALWNENDPILKERLFGLTGPEGNHGEDVKEEYFHLDATPSHSYLEYLYRYPQRLFPYEQLVAGGRSRGIEGGEFELADTGAFDDGRFFDVRVAYAKAAPDDLAIEIRVANRGPEAAVCHVLPTLWFRNTWSWGYPDGPMGDVAGRPVMSRESDPSLIGGVVRAEHPALGTYRLFADGCDRLVFTQNETNTQRLGDGPNSSPYSKDAFHRFLVDGETEAVNPAESGTKAAALYRLALEPGEETTLRLRLTAGDPGSPFADFDDVFSARRVEADEFYESVQSNGMSAAERHVQRAALAGMIWSKQLYYFDVEQWLDGDPIGPNLGDSRRQGRNRDWRHLNNFDIISMPDAWEYPWFAAWDLAFHCVTLARIDPTFAKRQLELLTREWYMHPNGQLPAYEWEFGDVNPPVHAWAARRVYEIDAAARGAGDIEFLERVFHKLLLNFTWWVNRKDVDGNNVFEGGFLGLDNVSLFDRSAPLPGGGHLDQSDGTAWMAFFTLEMLAISLELARTRAAYQDLATKFFEHFMAIATAMSAEDHALWDTTDEFFYDVLRLPEGESIPLKVRSMVGLIPLLAVTVIDSETMETMPEFAKRMEWFLQRRPHLSGNVVRIDEAGSGQRHLASMVTPERLRAILRYLLDEEEFLSPFGIRSLSKHHRDHPFELEVGGDTFRVGYEPGESTTGLYGGNSNWRGPVWFPLNYLIVEALERLHTYFGDDFRIECPTGSGEEMTLSEVAAELTRRLGALFLPDISGVRPFRGVASPVGQDPAWKDLLLFHEYFHGDDGHGLGASHQTGWTGLIADLIGDR